MDEQKKPLHEMVPGAVTPDVDPEQKPAETGANGSTVVPEDNQPAAA